MRRNRDRDHGVALCPDNRLFVSAMPRADWRMHGLGTRAVVPCRLVPAAARRTVSVRSVAAALRAS